jgi:Predicted aminopeptidases
MQRCAEIILGKYLVRKTAKQKGEFADWLRGYLREFGYSLVDDKYSAGGTNLIVGDVGTAEVILTAHYDTQPNFFFPLVMGFSNWGFFLISQIASMIPVLAVFFAYLFIGGPIFGGSTIFMILPLVGLVLYTLQIMCGIANRHTANDNTSGVVTLISILERLTAEERKKVCVVFFDQEELGLIGSANFKKKYAAAVADKPLFNFDCVSDGGILTFVMKKKFRESKYAQLLSAASADVMESSGTKKKTRFADALTNVYTSDQIIFPHGVGVVAAKKAPVLGYYINRIHSKFDTVFDSENIELLADTMAHFVRGM